MDAHCALGFSLLDPRIDSYESLIYHPVRGQCPWPVYTLAGGFGFAVDAKMYSLRTGTRRVDSGFERWSLGDLWSGQWPVAT